MNLLCSNCGQPGRPTVDPFAEEIYGDLVETVLCDPCYADRVLEI